MFKVECPGCRAPYQVDERRVPKTGLKMRCPKCGTSFNVDSPAEPMTPAPVLGAALGLKGDERPARSRAAAAGLKSTMLGVAAPAGLLDDPKPQPPRPPPPRLRPDAAPAEAPPVAQPPPAAPGRPPPPARPAPVRPAPARPVPARPAPQRPPPPTRPGGPPRPALPDPEPTPEVDPYAEAELPMLGQSAPIAPPFVPAQAPMAGSTAPGGFDLDLADAQELDDLPAVPARQPPRPGRPAPPARVQAPNADLDLPDLPAARPPNRADLPAVPAQRTRSPTASVDLEVDLPAIAAEGAGGTVDLPAVPHQRAGSSDDEFALDSRQDGLHDPLAGAFDLDLPTPSADLPSAVGSADVPVLSLDSVLPSPATELPSLGRTDLPSTAESLPAAASALPEVANSLPARQEAPNSRGFGDAMESFALESIPPAGADAGFGELELPLGSDPFAGTASTTDLGRVTSGDFGDIPEPDLGDLQQGDRASFSGGEFDAFSQDESGDADANAGPAHVERQAGGGVSFGEVNLGGSDIPAAEMALDDVRPPQLSQSEEDMEFGAIPQEDAAPAGASAGASQVRMPVGALPPERAKKTGKGAQIALGALVLVCVGGGALALVPRIGPFGYYVINDALRSGEYQAATADAVANARKALAKDTFPAAKQAVARIDALRESMPRVRPLAAYAAFVSFARELRFGADPVIHARASVSLEGLKDAGDVEYLKLAEAAREAVDGKPSTARRSLKSILTKHRSSIDAWIVLAELELKGNDKKAATEAWEAAKKLENSPRTSFGLARAMLLVGEADKAEELARETLSKAPEHAGAKLLIARVTWHRDPGDETIKLVKSAIEGTGALSPHELVLGHTLLGNIYLVRSRIGLAEEAFTQALKVDAKAAAALRGLGSALYAAARYSEALARFEAAAQADPADLMAKIGIVKCKLVLERVKEAADLAQTLRDEHPDSADAALWHGQALEALGQREAAEKAYRDAVRLSPKDASAVEPYVSLSLLLNQLGKPDEAQELLDRARSELPESPAIHRAMGDVALAQGRYDDALGEYDQALKLDASDLRALFQKGITERRAGKLKEAQATFDSVAQVDKEYPGLALERGLLFEAAGRSDDALKEYESALSKAPEDPDLMLRVGCSKAASGRSKDAEKLLREVLKQRPNSAETNYCLGRALLLDPARLSDAQRALERAVNIDPHRPEYHLYVGWAANEARNFSKASQALEKALSLDKSLADAYWQRGVLLARQGAVKDAIIDLKKALELRSSRYEAHAALADAYYDLGREQEALSEWHLAVTAMPEQSAWHFRYGKLLLANRHRTAAEAQLSEALKQVEKDDPQPRWVPEAHLLLAQALGIQPAAKEHWVAFLEQGPKNSPYRAEAEAAVRKLGGR